MIVRSLFTLLLPALLFSCKAKQDNAEQPAATTADTTSSKEPFYPITQYIEGQIAYVDSTPLAIEKQTFVNSRRVDSTIIDRAAFRQLATDFMQPDLNLPNVKPLYKETKFHDLTINTLTFSYNTTNPSQAMQQRDILLDPNTQKVKTVLFRKVEQRGDTTITTNGLWQHNMNFQLNYIIEPKTGPLQTMQVKVIWDRPFVKDEE